MFGYDLGIDMGTSNVVITVPGKGVVINEPSYVAYDTETEKILYAGRRAYHLEGREPNGITVLQPRYRLIQYDCSDDKIFYRQSYKKEYIQTESCCVYAGTCNRC